MKIEQIENNKIQIFLSNEDLKNKNISIHSIMANSNDAQNLFGSILESAEKELGFITQNCDIAIETLILNNSNLIFTITRIKKEQKRSKLNSKRKFTSLNSTFKFKNFDDFYEFFQSIKFSPYYIKSLFYFNNNFYYIDNELNSRNNQKFNLLEYANPCNIPNDLIKTFGTPIY